MTRAGDQPGRHPAPGDRLPAVHARPVRAARVAYVSAAFVLAVFVVVAIVEPVANAGASFNLADQVATGIIGIVLAVSCTVPARPRLVVDGSGIHVRQFLGGWRTVPWDLVVRVEFPPRNLFARVVLPGDEAIGLYAVQRWDGERAVTAMKGLRSWYLATRAAPPSPS